MVVLCIISVSGHGRCSQGVPEIVDLVVFLGTGFALASPPWVLSGTILCFLGAYGSGVTHLLNMLEFGVGMGLMSSLLACSVRLKKRKSDIMHYGLIVIVLDVVLFEYYRFQ